jgi:hypothetical protein
MIDKRTRRPRKAQATRSAANPHAGEHNLVLAGTSYLLRPAHSAIVAIEEATGKTLLTLARDGSVGNLASAELGLIACELIRAGATNEADRYVNAERLEQLIYEEGTAVVTVVLALCLSDAASGGRTASGERRAPTA